MSTKNFATLFLCLVGSISFQAYSQTGFLKKFKNSQWMLSSSIAANDNGGLFFAGNTDGSDDLFYINTDSAGSPVWSKKTAGTAQTCEKVLYHDGHYYVYGTTQSYAARKQLYLAKLDAGGNLIWFKTFAFDNEPHSSDALISSGNEIVLIGEVMDTAAFRSSGFFTTLDTSGNLITSKIFSNTSYSYRFNKISESNGNFIIVGTYGFGFMADFLLLSLDQSGAINFTKPYGQSAGWLTGVQTFSNGDFIVTGWTDNHPNGHWKEILTMKFSASGDYLWTKTFGGELALDEAASNSLVTSNDDVLINGTSNGRSMVVKMDSSGELLNSKVYAINTDSVLLELFYQMVELPNHRYVGLGGSLVENHPQEVFIMDLNEDLSTSCMQAVDSLVADTMSLSLIQLQPVVTSEVPLDTFRAVSLVDYTPTVVSACDEVNSAPEISAQSDFSIYPNPADNLLHVTSSEPLISAEILNVLGGIVIKSASESTIDIGKLSTGIYLLRLQTADAKSYIYRVVKQ